MGSWPWPWPRIGSYWIPSCITCRPLPTHQISLKSKKLFFVDGRTYARTDGHLRPALLGRLGRVDLIKIGWSDVVVIYGHDNERKGQDRHRTGKKSQKGYISPICGKAPTKAIYMKICLVGNHVCQVSKRNFLGLRFYRGSNFPFSHWLLNGPYNSAALLRCLWSAEFTRELEKYGWTTAGCYRFQLIVGV